MSKDTIRTAIFAAQQFKSKVIDIFGQSVEIKQPSIGELLGLTSGDDKEKQKLAVAQILINYAYVPDTNEHVFDKADYDSIVNLPSGAWVGNVITAWTELVGSEETSEKNSA